MRFVITALWVVACLKNSDCILAPANCCSCNQGGKLKAWHQQEQRQNCADRICPQVISKDKSCQAKAAVCQDQVCVLKY